MIHYFSVGRTVSASGCRPKFSLLSKGDLGLEDYELLVELALGCDRDYRLVSSLCIY